MFSVIEHVTTPLKIECFIRDAYTILLGDDDITDQPATQYEDLTALMEQRIVQSPNRYLSSMRVISKLVSLQTLIDISSITQTLESLANFKLPTMCGGPVLHVSGEKVQIPGSDGNVSWHQDWPNTGGSRNSVTLWVPIGGCSTSGGGLTLAVGTFSQLLAYRTNQAVCAIDNEITKDFEEVIMAPAVGDGLLFGQMQPHKSHPGETTRMAVSFRFEDAAEREWRDRDFEYLHHRVKKNRDFGEWV